MNETLRGRVAVITGASSGIGEATARALAAGGARVALLARRRQRIEALADELSGLAVEADVNDRTSIDTASRRIEERLGRVSILVNNAGVMLLGRFAAGERDAWRRMVETNLLGAMTATDVFLGALRDGGGDVVNVSSVAGRKARPTSSVYSATKWGLNGWSEALRQELIPDGVRVVAIEPGAVETELMDHIPDQEVQAASRRLYRDVDALRPDDVAQAIVFAVSRPARVSVSELMIRPTKQEY